MCNILIYLINVAALEHMLF